MVVVSGGLLALAAVLLLVGLLDGSGFLYASIAVTLVAAAMLPLGVLLALRGDSGRR